MVRTLRRTLKDPVVHPDWEILDATNSPHPYYGDQHRYNKLRLNMEFMRFLFHGFIELQLKLVASSVIIDPIEEHL